jgi:hypothetical protein
MGAAAELRVSSGEFSLSRARIHGSQELSARGLVFELLGTDASDNFTTVGLTAGRAAINVTTSDDIDAVPNPANPAGKATSIAIGPPRFSEDSLRDVMAKSNQFLRKGTLMAQADDSNVIVNATTKESTTVDASKRETWRTGLHAAGIGSQSPATGQEAAIEPGFIRVAGRLPRLSIRGNFSLSYWGATLAMTSARGHAEYRSDHWTVQDTPTVPRVGSLARHERYQFVRMTLTNATLQIVTTNHLSRFVAYEATDWVTGDVRIMQARGTMQGAKQWLHLKDSPLAVGGQFGFSAQRDASDAKRMVAQIYATDATALAPTAELMDLPSEESRVALADLPTKARAGVIAALVLIPLGLVAVGVRRFATGTIDDAELALLRGRPRRAVRIARRLVRREPSNADVLFLYGAGLFHAGDVRRLTTEVALLARKIPRQQRLGISFMLAIAHAHLADFEAAESWATEASDVPEYRPKLAPILERAGVASAAVPGYA